MSTALDSDADPTYTHFGHRDEFQKLLGRLLELDLGREPTVKEEEDEVKLVDQMGDIVSTLLSPKTRSTMADMSVAGLLSAPTGFAGSFVVRYRPPVDGYLDDRSFNPSK